MTKYKRCTKCKKKKLLSQFNKKGDKHSSWCRMCNSKNLKNHYAKNPDYYKNKKQRLKKKIRQAVADFKSRSQCECGEDNPACLVFHHKDPSTKKFQIGSNMTSCTSLKRLMEEINKCEVLCANCHLKLHAKDREGV